MHLSEDSLVRCSKKEHTLLQTKRHHPMSDLPTLIILAEPTVHTVDQGHLVKDTPSDSAMRQFSALNNTLRMGLDSGFPLMLVAPPLVADQARQLLRNSDVVNLPDAGPDEPPGDTVARAVATGVQASAHAPGWLLLPADMAMLKVATLHKLGKAVGHHPVVFPQYRQQAGHPVGFSPEFFSELIRLDQTHSLSRLMARYPSMGIDVDDPGVLMNLDHLHGSMAHFHTQLQGRMSWSGWR
jgi:molybdenum cofactor cytidylyltransferase